MEVVFQRISQNTYLVLDDFANEKLPSVFVCDVKRQKRNPDFHRKVFAFFRFCFHHWVSDREFMSSAKQFDVFRDHMTVLSGYYDEYYTIDESVRIEAQSLSYDAMDEIEFKEFYSALINTAMRKIFVNCDKEVENKLIRFFY